MWKRMLSAALCLTMVVNPLALAESIDNSGWVSSENMVSNELIINAEETVDVELSTETETDAGTPVVQDADAPVIRIAIPEQIDLNVGEIYQLSPKLLPEGAVSDLVYQADDADIISISETGGITALRDGSTYVYVRAANGGYTAECMVNVSPRDRNVIPEVTEIVLPEEIRLQPGEYYQLSAKLLPEGAQSSIRYTVIGESVALWGSDMLWVMPSMEPGESTLIAKAENGVTASCPIITYVGDEPFERLTIEDGVLVKYEGAKQDVVLPDTIRKIGSNAFAYAGVSIFTLKLPDGLKEIADEGLKSGLSVSELTIPDSVTRMGRSAMAGLTALHVKLPSGLDTLEEGVLQGASVMTIDMPENLTAIGKNAFEGCYQLTTIDIPDTVTSIGDGAFRNCPRLGGVVLPSGLKYLGEKAFSGTGIASISVPGSLKKIADGAFAQCSSLEKITIAEGVTEIGAKALANCPKLSVVNIPESVTSIHADAFANSGNVVVYAKDGSYAQQFCRENGLECLSVNDEFVMQDGKLTKYLGQAADVVIPEGVTEIGERVFAENSVIRSVQLPKSLEGIGEYAFYHCVNLKSVELPDSLKKIDSYAFKDCTALVSVSIPPAELGVSVFEGCTSLASAEYQTGAIRSGARTFYGCTALKSVALPVGMQSLSESTFAKCTALKNIDIPNSVTYLGSSLFAGCTSLVQLVIPDHITQIDYSIAEDCISLQRVHLPNSLHFLRSDAFSGCTALTRVAIPEGTYELENRCFEGCASLLSVIVPASVKQIGADTFKSCPILTVYGEKGSKIQTYCKTNSLKFVLTSEYPADDDFQIVGSELRAYLGDAQEVTIPAGVKTICEGAFAGNAALKTVVIPKGVTDIDSRAFANCAALTSVTVPASVTSIADDAFAGCGAVVMRVYRNSTAHRFCTANQIKCTLIDDETATVAFAQEEIVLGVKQAYPLKVIVEPESAAGEMKFESSKSSVASVNKATGVVTAKKTGTAMIRVTLDSGAQAICKVVVRKAPSTVKLSENSLVLGVGQQHSLSYTLTKNTVASVKFESNNLGIVEIDANGMITAVGEGKAAVRIVTHNGKKAVCNIEVKKAPDHIAFESEEMSMGAGQSGILRIVVPEGCHAQATFDSSNDEILSVAANGEYLAKNPGMATVTATSYNGKTAVAQVIVKEAPTRIRADQSAITIGVGDSVKWDVIAGTAAEDYVGGIEYQVKSSKIAAIDENGVVMAKKTGTTYVRASTYNGHTVDCKIVVRKAPSSVKFDAPQRSMYVGEMSEAKLMLPKNTASTIRLESSHPQRVAIAEDGSLQAVGLGEALITAITHNGKKAYQRITVYDLPERIRFDQESSSISVGEIVSLNVDMGPEAFDHCSFTSSDPDVVDLKQMDNGKVSCKAKAAGTATVTATTSHGLTAQCIFTVLAAPYKVKFEAPSMYMSVGEMYTPQVFAYAKDGSLTESSFVFKSSNKKIAEVDENGKIRCHKTGSVKITAKSHNGKTATLKITVRKPPAGIELSANPLRMAVGESYRLGVRLPENSGGEVRFVSNNPDVVTVDAEGNILALKEGTAEVMVTCYPVNSVCEVEVGPLPTSIRFADDRLDLNAGMRVPLDLQMEGGATVALQYESMDPKVAIVENGMLVAKKAGQTTITAKTPNGLTAQFAVHVLGAPTKGVLRMPAKLELGQMYNVAAYFSTSPAEGMYSAIEDVRLSSSKYALLMDDGESFWIVPHKTGSFTVYVKTYNGKTIKQKVSVVQSAPAEPSQIKYDAVLADYQGVYVLDYAENNGIKVGATDLYMEDLRMTVSGESVELMLYGVGVTGKAEMHGFDMMVDFGENGETEKERFTLYRNGSISNVEKDGTRFWYKSIR